MIVVFPDNTHLLFDTDKISNHGKNRLGGSYRFIVEFARYLYAVRSKTMDAQSGLRLCCSHATQ